MFLSAFVLYGSSYDLRPSRWSFHGQALFAHFAQQSDDEVPPNFPTDGWSKTCQLAQVQCRAVRQSPLSIRQISIVATETMILNMRTLESYNKLAPVIE